MDDQRIVISSALAINPETVRDREFASVFRGYQPSEVRQFLRRVAEEMTAAAEREAEAVRAMHAALTRAAHPELDEASLTAALGDHTARLFASARETAAGITVDAEKSASSMVRDAEARVARMRQDAEDIVSRRLEEADGVAGNLRQTAQAEARAIRDQAEAEAEAALQSARSQGKEMVAEAREVRERMLSDLSRRRRAAQVQLEQLRVARERLLAALEVVRRTLDEATDELAAAEPEARLAAEEVAREMAASPPPPDTFDLRSAVEPADDSPPPSPLSPLSPFVSPIITKVVPPAPPSTPSPFTPLPSSPSALPAGLDEGGSLGSAARAASSWRDTAGWPDLPARDVSADAGSRPVVRPQSVAESVPAGVASPPVDEPGGELATGEVPAVARSGAPVVEELFARIRADRPAAPSSGGSIEAAAPEVTSSEGESHSETLVGGGGLAPADTEVEAGLEGGQAQHESTAEPGESARDMADESALAHRDQLLDPLDSAIVRALKRVMRDEQNEMLDRLRRLSGRPVSEALPGVEEQREAYRAPVAPLLSEAAKAGGAGVDTAIAEGWADALSDTLITPLRERLERTLTAPSDEVAVGESEAAEGVRVAYRQCRLSEIDPLVRHHTAAAFSRGAFAALPAGSLMRWVVDDDGACPDCDDNALAGPTPKGDEFPTGQPYPPAHPGCRCLLVPAS